MKGGDTMPRKGGVPQNLIRNEDMTPEERRARTSKMGKASAKAKRDKRMARERLAYLLELAMIDGKGNGVSSPITGKPMSVGEAIDTAMIKKAVNGDVKAATAIYDILNVKTVRTEVTGANGEPLIPVAKMTDEELKAEIERVTNNMK